MFRAVLPLVVAAAGLAALTSCSTLYDVTFDVRLDPRAAPPGARIGLRIDRVGSGQPETASLPLLPGTTRYTHTVTTCCAPRPTVALSAWLDVNGNQVPDPGEPVARDPRNPLTLTGPATTVLWIPTGAPPDGATASPG